MTAPQATQRDIHAAAIQWCGEKDRETSLDDIRYFQNNWRSLPGFRSRVEAFARHRQAALSELEGERANVEAVAEALHGLSAILLLTGALEDDKTHAAYEKVVTCFATLLGEPQ